MRPNLCTIHYFLSGFLCLSKECSCSSQPFSSQRVDKPHIKDQSLFLLPLLSCFLHLLASSLLCIYPLKSFLSSYYVLCSMIWLFFITKDKNDKNKISLTKMNFLKRINKLIYHNTFLLIVNP